MPEPERRRAPSANGYGSSRHGSGPITTSIRGGRRDRSPSSFWNARSARGGAARRVIVKASSDRWVGQGSSVVWNPLRLGRHAGPASFVCSGREQAVEERPVALKRDAKIFS